MQVKQILSQWLEANNWEYVESSKSCSGCYAQFITGDITLLFDPEEAIQRSAYLCEKCGYEAIVQGMKRPAGISVFIQKEHLTSDMGLMDESVRERIEKAFKAVDALILSLEQAAQAGQTVSVETARKQLEDADKPDKLLH